MVALRNGKLKDFRILTDIWANIRYTKNGTYLHLTFESNCSNIMKTAWGKEMSANWTNTDVFVVYMFQLKLAICMQGKLCRKRIYIKQN